MYHPWRAFRNLANWTLIIEPLPDDLMGLTDWDERTITLAPGLTQVERRSTVAHEVVHVERGPVIERLEPREEAWVAKVAARRLISFEALARAIVWARDVYQLAEELWVDVGTVRCRLENLHPSERMHLVALVRARDGQEDR